MGSNHKGKLAMERTATLRTKTQPASTATNADKKRKPLADCSNTIASRASSHSSFLSFTPSKTQNPTLSSVFKSLIKDTGAVAKSKFASTAGSTDVNRNQNRDISTKSSSTLSRQLESPSHAGPADKSEVTEPASVYGRRRPTDRRQSKRKVIAEPLSCNLERRITNIGDQANNDRDAERSKSCSIPHKKRQRTVKAKKKDTQLENLQDFIEKQRAYFAEIDAFELPEEEVNSEDELE